MDQLWASVLPRSPLRESRLYSLKTQGNHEYKRVKIALLLGKAGNTTNAQYSLNFVLGDVRCPRYYL